MVEEGQLQMGEMGKAKVKMCLPVASMRVTGLIQRSNLEGGWGSPGLLCYLNVAPTLPIQNYTA